MSTARRQKALPQPTPDSLPFWEGTKQHDLRIQRCDQCGRFNFPPRMYCPQCLSERMGWVQAGGRGKLYSYVISHRAAPGFEEEAPYVIAVVELDEGPRMMSNIVGVEPQPEKLLADLRVEVVWDDVNEEITLPKFRPA